MAGKAGGSVSGSRAGRSIGPSNRGAMGHSISSKERSRDKAARAALTGVPSKNKKSRTQPKGGPTATAANAPEGSLRVMRKSTWDRMTAGVKMREYNTTSYAKYKASQMPRGKTSARDMKSL